MSETQLDRIERMLRTLLGDAAEPAPSPEKWLRIEQAADLCGFAPYTLRKACSQGRITDCRKGDDGLWRLDRQAVERIRDNGLPPLQQPAIR